MPVRAYAHQMTDPTMEGRDELPGDDKEGWLFRASERTPGPWIVTAWHGQVLLSRPTLLIVKEPVSWTAPESSEGALLRFGDNRVERGAVVESAATTAVEREAAPPIGVGDLPADVLPLAAIVELPNPKERQQLMREAVVRMAKDASHPDWQLAQGFLDTMKHFPADSYEFNRAIAEHPEAVALAMLRGAWLDSWKHLWSGFEQLGLVWHAFPLKVWVRTVRIYKDTAFPAMPEDERTSLLGLVLGRCFEASETTQYRSVIWELCGRSIYGVPRPPNSPFSRPDGAKDPQQIVRGLAKIQMTQVEQQHSDERYPPLPPVDEFLLPGVAEAVKALTPEVGMDDRRDVARAPLLAAAASVHALRLPPKVLFELRRVRDFDPTYFDCVYNAGLACLALDKNHDYFN